MTEYRRGILSEPIDLDGGSRTNRKTYPKVPATIGLDVVHVATGCFGSVRECTDAAVTLRDDSGRDQRFRNTPGAFTVEGRHVQLVTARTSASSTTVTASGSISHGSSPARVARASRILVEGVHDAELIEKVWGDDLRDEGIVVQPLGGVDDLVEVVRGFGPRPGRRLGVLVDHLVDRSKESRIAAQVDHPDVLVRGHVFVDVWAAIDPKLVGLDAWPDVPLDREWKAGICEAVGVDDPRRFWKQLIGRVASYRDLDPSLVGAVEELIDFVCEPAAA
jgi:hypothetical protein